MTNTNDSGSGSLREAVLDSNASNGTVPIVFDPAVIGQTISVLNALELSANTDIDGNVDIFLDQNTSLFSLTEDSTTLTLDVNNITIDVDETQTTDTTTFLNFIDVIADGVTINNNSNIDASGIGADISLSLIHI